MVDLRPSISAACRTFKNKKHFSLFNFLPGDSLFSFSGCCSKAEKGGLMSIVHTIDKKRDIDGI